MSKIKLIAIDIDGTLLNSKRELTDPVKDAIRRAKDQGIKVVICTGRPLKGVLSLLEELDLIGEDQYVITYNGALIQSTAKDIVVAEYPLTLKDFEKISRVADDLNVPYHASTRQALYTTNRDIGRYTAHEADLVQMQIRYRTADEMKDMSESIQKMMFVDEPDRLDEVINTLPDWFKKNYFTVKSAPYYLEILNLHANKGNAVKALTNFLNIDLSQVMAIGDNYNDADMLAIVKYSVAMGNAVPAIKKMAKFVTKTNDEDGVAVIINELIQ